MKWELKRIVEVFLYHKCWTESGAKHSRRLKSRSLKLQSSGRGCCTPGCEGQCYCLS